MTGHDELLERLREATGPNFDLECAIFKAIGGSRFEYDAPPPNYTASIDTALTLVPQEQSSNFEVCLEQHKRRTRTWWSVIIGHFNFGAWTAEHSSPAIAICIAALSARSTPERGR